MLASVGVATLHIRNVPADLYDRLKAAAQASGRSLNAEVIQRLQTGDDDRRGNEQWWAEFVALGDRIAAGRKPGDPWLADQVRRDRESR